MPLRFMPDLAAKKALRVNSGIGLKVDAQSLVARSAYLCEEWLSQTHAPFQTSISLSEALINSEFLFQWVISLGVL
jgi:hypothetical protein